MQYDPMLPEGPKKEWREMSPKEAKVFFTWFSDHIPAKMEQLKTLLKATGYDPNRLDYSDDSLIFIWRWYRENIQGYEIPEDEIRAYAEKYATALRQIGIEKGGEITDESYQRLYSNFYNDAPKRRVSPPWGFIAMDIGIYLGECLIRKYPEKEFSWGYFTNWKSDSNVNRHVLMGLEFVRNVFWEPAGKPRQSSPFTVDLMHLVYTKAGENLRDNKRNEKTILDLFRYLENYVYHMNSPQNLTEIREMNEKQAHQYFEWFTDQIKFNISQMSMCDIMDFSTASLPLVWERFLTEVATWEKEEEKKRERLKLGKKNRMPFLKKRVIDGIEVYERIIFRALELSIYFAETFRHHHEDKDIKWGYVTEPKTLTYVNRPVLVGFKDPATQVMDQVSLFSDLAVRIAKGDRNKDALIELYYEWDKKV